jgi:hypothetical protein
MERQLALQHLAEAERHVAEGHETIQRQRRMIATLERDKPGLFSNE